MSSLRQSKVGSSDCRGVKLWIDHQLSPQLISWLEAEFDVEAVHVRDLDLQTAEDLEIFHAARTARAAVMTKDRDFTQLVERLGAPPQVLWVTCGNTSNVSLQRILGVTLEKALRLLGEGEPLVEISDATRPPSASL